jgi:hypothetical protein
MKETTIDMADLPWKNQFEQKAPLDKPVISRAPTGAMRVTCGRPLLDWSLWLTVDEFSELVNKACK